MTDLKKIAADEAASRVTSGQRLGLGTGSTASLFLEALARRLSAGELDDIAGVPTSRRTEALARELAIPLLSLDEAVRLDLAVDGADEVDPDGHLIKGLGGALLREKIVEQASERFIVIVDEGKLVERLGSRSPVPAEVLPFGWKATAEAARALGCEPALRTTAEGPYRTDQGNYILDCRFAPMRDPASVAARLDAIPGILGHGLFLDMATEVIVGTPEGPRTLGMV